MRYLFFMLLCMVFSACTFIPAEDSKPPDKEDAIKLMDRSVDSLEVNVDTNGGAMPILGSIYPKPYSYRATPYSTIKSEGVILPLEDQKQDKTVIDYHLAYSMAGSKSLNTYNYTITKKVFNYHLAYSKVS